MTANIAPIILAEFPELLALAWNRDITRPIPAKEVFALYERNWRFVGKPEHKIIAEAVGLMDRDFLTATRCWLGGGTAIAMKLGEYRRSLDLDFRCADAGG